MAAVFGAVGIDGGPATEQVDHALEAGFFTDGQLNGHRTCLEPAANGLDGALVACAHPVHFVDEANAGHVVLICLAPHRLRLGLHAGHGIHNYNAAIQDAQAPFHLGGEVHMAGGIDDIDPMVAPIGGGGGGGDCDAPFPFLGHPVHGGGPLVHLPHAADPPGQKQQPFGNGRLAGIYVGNEPDIANLADWKTGIHVLKCSAGTRNGA